MQKQVSCTFCDEMPKTRTSALEGLHGDRAIIRRWRRWGAFFTSEQIVRVVSIMGILKGDWRKVGGGGGGS